MLIGNLTSDLLIIKLAASGGSSYKGKGLMTEPEEPAVELLTMQIGSGSGYGNTQEDDVPLGNHADDAAWREGLSFAG